MDPRWIIPFAANLLLAVLAGEMNHYLAPWGCSILLSGLVLPVAALRLSLGPGLVAMVLTGFALDALGPTAFGANAAILSAGLLILHAIRHRLVREGAVAHLVVALLANLVIFVTQPMFAGGLSAYATPTPLRIVMDLFLSQLVLAAAALWFFALQERALVLWGVDLTEELRHHR